MPAMVVGCGCWWLVAEADAGASGAASPRWSVGTISTSKRSAWWARRTLVGPGVGRRGQRGGVEQGLGGGKIGTARQRRLPGRVGRWRQAG